MIEGFEVIDIEKRKFKEQYLYRFNLNGETFYSCYMIYPLDPRIEFHMRYYLEPALMNRKGTFTEKERHKLVDIVLSRKEIRLRHLFEPFKFV